MDYDISNQQLHKELERLQQRITALENEAEIRKTYVKLLLKEKEMLAITLRSIGDGVITTDTQGLVVMMNPVAETLTGWNIAEAQNKPLREVFHIISEKTGKEVENPVQKVLDTGLIRGLANSTLLISQEGNSRVIADSAAPIIDTITGQILGVVLVFRDVTHERKLELEVARAEKLESVGILAGGIAHDFNNVLTSIAGNIWLAKLATKDQKSLKVEDLLAEAESQTFRAKELTHQLLTFSKGGAPIKKISSLQELVRETAIFALHGSNVRCVFALPEDLWVVNIDTNQISQVINNLIINADQAMPEGGIITITAENVLANSVVRQDEPMLLKTVDYVKVSIQDDGIGISQEALTKIFEPYFTTKSSGSGLGLATSFSIISKHKGFLGVTSKLGKGATFFLYLPALSGEVVAPFEKDSGEKLVSMYGGKVLIVDDQNDILVLLKRVLGLVGYEVVTALDGAMGIELYREALESANPFQAVILDLTIPGGMGGKETIQHLLAIDPQVKAIVTSGYSNDPILSNFEAYGFKGALSKPFKFLELREKLDAMLA
ncbi:MAG: response regulator [Chloroflexi bacterium]|uniref:histidine kinase n=1 Tax=Candidatus Chlorohelix allophototropha TaxID=3003348 RepID=A0A8T7M2I2_9CHLR|nr:response regulator [Chloroflexota bacterium]WJW65858.1 ATP-binding protein [Chloroflexota bacterium L227-S17]